MGGRDFRISACEGEHVFGRLAAQVVNGAERLFVFQDVLTGVKLAGRKFTFSAWVRARTTNSARLLLADGTISAHSTYHANPGDWAWLSVTLIPCDRAKYIRAHLELEPGASAWIDGAVVCEGDSIDPFAAFAGDPANALAKGFHGIVPETAELDIDNYRVNHPHLALQISGNEIETNIPSTYGMRMYGGVNSDVPKTISELVRKFEPVAAKQFHAGAICSQLIQPKLLDLLGCGYDVDETGKTRKRATSLSRFMLFTQFETLSNHKEVLERLAAADFVARDRLLVEADPGMVASRTARSAEMLSYSSQATSKLSLTCNSAEPALLFFGDNYHPGWRAYVDGQERPILRADYAFMAVAVPAGECTVVFQFQPSVFTAGLAVSGAGLLGYLAALAVAARRYRSSRAKPALPENTGVPEHLPAAA
jgi:hypothetical protein